MCSEQPYEGMPKMLIANLYDLQGDEKGLEVFLQIFRLRREYEIKGLIYLKIG